jgi:hypothetical protein
MLEASYRGPISSLGSLPPWVSMEGLDRQHQPRFHWFIVKNTKERKPLKDSGKSGQVPTALL